MTFCRVGDIDGLDLWSEECIQIIKTLFQWRTSSSLLNGFQLSLIAALYIDSTEQAHARSTFADLLKHTSTINPIFQFSDAYDHGKLAIYMYMAVTQEPLEEDHDPLAALYHIIGETITEQSKLQLSGLHIMGIAVKHAHKTASTSSVWLRKQGSRLLITLPSRNFVKWLGEIDHWVLLHLDTLLAPKSYLLPEEVES